MRKKTSTSPRPRVQAKMGSLEVISEGFGPVEKSAGMTLEVSTTPSISFATYGSTEIESPPFSMDDWAIAPEFSTRLTACISLRALNAGGHGYEVISKKKYIRQVSRSRKELNDAEKIALDKLQEEIDVEKEIVEDFFDHPNPEISFSRIMVSVLSDRETVGNGFLLVERKLDRPSSSPKILDRVVGHTVRIKKTGGYVARQQDGSFVHYKKWGNTSVVDNRTGKKHNENDGLLPPQYHAKELIHFKVDAPRLTSYGIPRHISTAPAIAGNRYAAERNSSFFENDATPRLAIVVQGPYRLSKDSRGDIKDFIERKGKGPGNSGRVMIIQAGKREGSMTEKEDVKIDFHKLTVGVSEEAGYLKYQDRGDKEIAEAFGIHPVFFEKDAVRASANVGRSITLDQTFEPDIVDVEYTLNNTVVPALGVDKVEIRLKRPTTIDIEGQAGLLKKLERTGGVTPNDVRDFFSKPRFRESWADIPLPLAMQHLKVPTDRAEGSSLISALVKMNDMIELELEKRDMSNEEDENEIDSL